MDPDDWKTRMSEETRGLARQLSEATGVQESDVQKILAELGVAEFATLEAPHKPGRLDVVTVREAMRQALKQVAM